MSEHNEHVYFVNQLYRDFLLPTILGGDTPAILYWAGKRITRKYALSEFEDLSEFFKLAEFGNLNHARYGSCLGTRCGWYRIDGFRSFLRDHSVAES